MMDRRAARKRHIAEINIVPYIDVMLVLLIIFMITAPLLNQGVEVNLPQADPEHLPQSEIRPLILTVDRDGAFYLNVADDPLQPLDEATILARAMAVMQRNADTPVLVKADKGVEYGAVVTAMVLLQRAGAEKVGLSTELPER